ncbi:MAG: indole-3-glycerol-phosphate synthase [Halococcoides sp.]
MTGDLGTFDGTLTGEIRRVSASESVFLLSEIKVRSPRDGALLGDRDPAETAQRMVAAGADGISVVVESDHFGGSLGLLETVSTAVDVPILAKDFFGTREDIDRAVDRGADAVLLIRQEMDAVTLETLYRHCIDAGIDPLLETHTKSGIETANDLGAPLIGINNRDIGQLELDDGGVERTESLAPLIHDTACIVSESSFSTPRDVARARAAGVDAVLIGTAILNAPDVRAKIDSLDVQKSLDVE